jgi:hypothetical protein
MYSSTDWLDAFSNDHHGETDHGAAGKPLREKEKKGETQEILGDRTAVVKTQSPSSADNIV